MHCTGRIAGVALLGTLFCASAAFADGESRLQPIGATLQGGAMLPSGAQGAGLDRGFQLVGTLAYDMDPAFKLEGDLGYISSPDPFHTRIFMIGANGRMNPNADWEELYVRAGAGLYRISHGRDIPGSTPPRNRIRPGLSFGVGYDVATASRLTVGFAGTYHGIIVAWSDALSYISLSAYLSLRPKS